MLSWVVCWLHGHVVCDGSVMVGKWGEAGWGEWVGGWSGRSHINDHCARTHWPMHSSLEVDGVSVVQ